VAGRHDGPVGYKLEVPPLHPALASTLLGGHGQDNALRMAELPHTHVMLALLRDGFHPTARAARWNCAAMARRCSTTPSPTTCATACAGPGTAWQIQFAAGARQVMPVHGDARYVQPAQGRDDRRPALELFRMRLGSAHVMGGCALGEDPRQAVCDSLGRHHQLENLSIHDGSLFPTSIGANPQLSVYARCAAQRSTGRAPGRGMTALHALSIVPSAGRATWPRVAALPSDSPTHSSQDDAMNRVLYPGTFDPITKGHGDLVDAPRGCSIT
jgi:choline dehydrogenase-like flavoprotein